jgi:hypothetical protein
MVHDSEGSLGNVPSVHELAAKRKGQQVDNRSFKPARHNTGDGSKSSPVCINTRVVQTQVANCKALPLEGQACNLASSHLKFYIEVA